MSSWISFIFVCRQRFVIKTLGAVRSTAMLYALCTSKNYCYYCRYLNGTNRLKFLNCCMKHWPIRIYETVPPIKLHGFGYRQNPIMGYAISQ